MRFALASFGLHAHRARVAAFASLASLALIGGVGCTSTQTVVVSQQDPTAPPALRSACGPQTRPTVDGTACSAVGPTAIPAGFEASADGWGFRAIRPTAACTGATRAVLGQTTCVPLDDCNAAFPPAGATAVVTANGASTLSETIQYAPAGSVIAVDRGTYVYNAHAGMLARPDIRVVGRCASDVIIQGDGTNAAFGIPRGHLTVEGVTLRNFATAVALSGNTASLDLRHVYFEADGQAVSADMGSQVTLSQSAFDGVGRSKVSSDPIRVVVAQHGSKVDVVESDVRDPTRAFTAFDQGSVVNVRRTIATSRIPSDDIFVLAMVGGAITIDESHVATERTSLVNAGESRRYSMVANDPAVVKIHASALEQLGAYIPGTTTGVMGGATLDVDESTVRYSSNLGLSAFEAGSHAKFHNSVWVAEDVKGQQTYGMSAIQGARVDLDGTAVVSARGLAIGAYDEGTVLSLTGSLVTGTVTASSDASGSATAIAVLVMKNAHATFADSAIAGNVQQGLVIANEALVDAEGLVVDGTTTDADGALGDGIYVSDDARLTMRASSVRRNAWFGLVMMRASGAVDRTRFEDNAGGAVDVWETTVSRPATAADPNARELVLTQVTFPGSVPEVQEGSVDVTLPAGAVVPPGL
ncbi:MAG: hypothetical protein JWM74_6105 [Myxococcaceae bacterium]|nr:hypothetical protein [Myxococcaceae bacterium]